MDNPVSITAVIPTLNNPAGFNKLLAELISEEIPVVVVNNGRLQITDYPSAGSGLGGLQNSKITILNPSKNLGFAGGVNLGAKQVTTKWLLILNDDVEGLTRQSVNRLIGKADENRWDAVSPILVNAKGKVENVGYKVLPIGKVELNFDQDKNDDILLDGLTAACLLIKREIFEKMGGFDVRFFAYLEDVDLFLRLKQAGLHFGVDISTQVIHGHLVTSKNMTKRFKQKQDLVNWWRIIVKHPNKFIFQPQLIGMLLERGRNVSGYIKAD